MARRASASPQPRPALTRRFSDRVAADARYVAAWDRWLVFDGAAWRPDVTLRVRGKLW